jgi:hypothetical protein
VCGFLLLLVFIFYIEHPHLWMISHSLFGNLCRIRYSILEWNMQA